ncbi:5-dehydro-4-deoxy-D-glucuronate isomerase [Verrucomicrobiaceae bacterium R5-34]|uniref:4-deoxy-L-threo-5-hexosulose-uronate ketol-isomerase n=1 Tax=Oceaniferula flava TaxID=2800421 RepID=A0AAE2SEP5_9BACT|nr:5-dehydro-4-deoxy-D-glucuronate isomerase [Oceaniferula flavus]MBK1831032.1 5-dehydro-4-deoxy-D-glucuronate isomerase [Verrucomicrobiaceae bacterium R5-34]MBK1855549.1 5-dehydro-4-deoxy-D-glucuronate isomerase [Oceaniferula flavus]MBM1136855.1 5-dehydro-4-deoxy-D-glucuronate isomerase [Oceaniferula flavus]
MLNHRTADDISYKSLDTTGLRDRFLLQDLFTEGQLQLVYTDLDRAIVGSAVPTLDTLTLSAAEALRAEYFCERRELGVINLGATGSITVDGESYQLSHTECLYIGRGSKEISFTSADAAEPAQFYLLSYPAHTDYPTAHAKIEDANKLELGSKAEANERHLYQYIHENGIQSCQLVMGFTILQPGSIWNTMPPHTHDRRSEVYAYFDVENDHRIAHFMGHPDETRVLWMSEKDIALSPSWSIHCGAGTGSYSFVWGMGGENQRFDDMDGFPLSTLK